MNNEKQNILIISEDNIFSTLLVKHIGELEDYQTFRSRSVAEVSQFLETYSGGLLAAIIDLDYKQSETWELVDAFTEAGIPTIIATSKIDEDLRKKAWAKRIVDYVVKENANCIQVITDILHRLRNNPRIKVLVVDDSTFFLKALTDLLSVHRYKLLSAFSGEEAMEKLEENDDIHLVLTDFEMPGMNGVDLALKIRQRHSKQEMAIIGCSSKGKQLMTANFLKNGANDFIIKQSFMVEEFYTRITQQIEAVERYHEMQKQTTHDELTGLYNRSYFFDYGHKMVANSNRNLFTVHVGVLKLDNFDTINNELGQTSGNKILKQIGKLLKINTRETDVVARIDGTELAIITVGVKNKNDLQKVFENLRLMVEKMQFSDIQHVPQITCSIGVSMDKIETLEDGMKAARQAMFVAKSMGKNQVILAPTT